MSSDLPQARTGVVPAFAPPSPRGCRHTGGAVGQPGRAPGGRCPRGGSGSGRRRPPARRPRSGAGADHPLPAAARLRHGRHDPHRFQPGGGDGAVRPPGRDRQRYPLAAIERISRSTRGYASSPSSTSAGSGAGDRRPRVPPRWALHRRLLWRLRAPAVVPAGEFAADWFTPARGSGRCCATSPDLPGGVLVGTRPGLNLLIARAVSRPARRRRGPCHGRPGAHEPHHPPRRRPGGDRPRLPGLRRRRGVTHADRRDYRHPAPRRAGGSGSPTRCTALDQPPLPAALKAVVAAGRRVRQMGFDLRPSGLRRGGARSSRTGGCTSTALAPAGPAARLIAEAGPARPRAADGPHRPARRRLAARPCSCSAPGPRGCPW